MSGRRVAQQRVRKAAHARGAERQEFGGDGHDPLAMSERQWMSRVMSFLRTYQWRHFHAPDNKPDQKTGAKQRLTPGFPDVVAERDDEPQLLVIELKTETGRLGAGQREWLAAFERTGAEVHIWRPSDEQAAHERLARGRTIIPTAW